MKKICSICKIEKNFSEYGYDKYKKNGRVSRCKECLKSIRKNINIITPGHGVKKCAKCKEEKDFSFFGKDKKGKFGLTCYCKTCTSIHAKDKRKGNPESWKKTKRKKFH